MAKYPAPSVPFVEAHHVGGPQKPTAIVLTLSHTTSDKGAALGVASYHHSVISPVVAHHYVLDEAETYRCVPDKVHAASCPHRALSVHICAQPNEYESLWYNGSATRVMHRAAALVADLILTHKIRPRYLDRDAEIKWAEHKWRHRGGLIVNVMGTWPHKSFLEDVQSQLIIKTM